MDLKFKLCGLGDLDLLVNIARETYFDTFIVNNTVENMREYLESALVKNKLIEEISHKDSEYYFAYLEESLVGYFKINSGIQKDVNNSNAIELERFYFRKEYQGRSLGKKMLNKVIEITKKKDVQIIWLSVWERNHRAIRFYTKSGFVKSGEQEFKMGQDVQTDHLMKFNLESTNV